jgi:toxin HigB-1
MFSKRKFYLSLALVTLPVTMILSFSSEETEKIWNGVFSKKLPGTIQEVARRKLRMLNNAQDIADLRIPPANRLEKLSGRLKEYYSIRINEQWRIIFKWTDNNLSSVNIVDYH